MSLHSVLEHSDRFDCEVTIASHRAGGSLPAHAMGVAFKHFAGLVALCVETAAAAIILYGAIEAIFELARGLFPRESQKGGLKMGRRRAVLVQFGVWLLIDLEFELVTDVVRTAIAPTWSDIGQLASIGVIRTFLNYFLKKDIKEYEAAALAKAKDALNEVVLRG